MAVSILVWTDNSLGSGAWKETPAPLPSTLTCAEDMRRCSVSEADVICSMSASAKVGSGLAVTLTVVKPYCSARSRMAASRTVLPEPRGPLSSIE